MHYLGIEIGGTKLQLALSAGQGKLTSHWRGKTVPADGAEGIRRQILREIPGLFERAKVGRGKLTAAGVGFGGPVESNSQTIIRSHQIQGWDDFPLGKWLQDQLHCPVRIGNDADVAALAEANFGAGRGLSPVFYVTIGSGIGGGLVVDGEIFTGAGRGAAEIGHLMISSEDSGRVQTKTLESWASGWAIQQYVRDSLQTDASRSPKLMNFAAGQIGRITVQHIAHAAERGDVLSCQALGRAISALSQGLCHVIALLCPKRIILGGGVSLIGEELLFAPLRKEVARQVFKPFAGLTEIVPAELGEEVVLHGAIAIAKQASLTTT